MSGGVRCMLYHLRLPWHCARVHPVGAGFVGRFGVPIEGLGHDAEVGVDGVVPVQDFAGVGGHAAEDGGHAALGAVFGFVEGLVVADGLEQVVVFLLVRIATAVAEAPGVLAANGVRADIATAFGALHVLGHAA